MEKAIFYSVISTSDPAKKYTVILTPDGAYRCNCPQFLFRNKKCKHIEKIQKPTIIAPPNPPQPTLAKVYGNRKLTWSQMLDEVKKMGKKGSTAPMTPIESDVRKLIF